jgi:hypothetical protein
MLLAKVIDNEILEVGDSFTLFPNTSFPSNKIDYQFLQENSVLEVVSWEHFNEENEKLIVAEPYIKEGKVYTCLKVAKTEAELQDDALKVQLAKENEVRNQRNQLLKDSDWTQVADAPVDNLTWAVYRQALRDITLQTGFPFNVVFPIAP